MNEEYLFNFARKNGWDKILEIADRDRSFDNIASELNKTELAIKIDLFTMEGFGLIEVEVTNTGGRNFFITDLGLKLIQKDTPE